MTEETRERSFDELAKGLASGEVSRGKALRLMGAALLGGTLASIPGVAWAARTPPTGKGGCPQGRTLCRGKCYDLKSDSQNCGQCGNVCSQSESCLNGVCCPTGTTNCGGTCVILGTNSNCGACGVVCRPGEQCIHGGCGCSLSSTGSDPCGSGTFCSAETHRCEACRPPGESCRVGTSTTAAACCSNVCVGDSCRQSCSTNEDCPSGTTCCPSPIIGALGYCTFATEMTCPA